MWIEIRSNADWSYWIIDRQHGVRLTMDEDTSFFILNQVEDDLSIPFDNLLHISREALEATLRQWMLVRAVESGNAPKEPSQKFVDKVFGIKEEVREALED